MRALIASSPKACGSELHCFIEGCSSEMKEVRRLSRINKLVMSNYHERSRGAAEDK